eukprot:Skav211635  [mRNA]  locus=scaffold2262:154654:155253:- [translate_table: standard]
MTYIGSTCQTLAQRMAQHRRGMTTKQLQHLKLYQAMREMGKENFYIELIENYPCQSQDELFKKEGERIREYKSEFNKFISGRDAKAYYHENKQSILDYQKQYQQENKNQIKERKHQRYLSQKPEVAERDRQYYQDNREKILLQKKEYNQRNQELISDKRKQHYQNKEQIGQRRKQYYLQNKELISERRKQLRMEKQKSQ